MNALGTDIERDTPRPEDFGMSSDMYRLLSEKKRGTEQSFDETERAAKGRIKTCEDAISSATRTVEVIENNGFIWLALALLFIAVLYLEYIIIILPIVFDVFEYIGKNFPEWLSVPVLFFLCIYSFWGFFALPQYLDMIFSISDKVRNFLSFGRYVDSQRTIEREEKNQVILQESLESVREERDRALASFASEAGKKFSIVEEVLQRYYQGRPDENPSTRAESLSVSLSSVSGMGGTSSPSNQRSESVHSEAMRSSEFGEGTAEHSAKEGFGESRLETNDDIGGGAYSEEYDDALSDDSEVDMATHNSGATPVPRKTDWAKVEETKGETGLNGEKFALHLEQKQLRKAGRADLADAVRHMSVEVGDGLGYDILSFFEDGREKYIEVKSTTVSIDAPYYISRNELDFFRKHRGEAFLYRMLIREDGSASARVISVDEMLDANELVPIQYLVRSKRV